jgi:hypothetical protein
MRPFRRDSSFVVGEKTEENKGGQPDYVDGFELSHWGNALHAAVDLPTLGLQGSLRRPPKSVRLRLVARAYRFIGRA